MIGEDLTSDWQTRFDLAKERFRQPLAWFPFPFLISTGLSLILTAHLAFSSNPRMGNPAEVITFPSTHQKDTAIWFSVTPIGRDILITTNDRKVFRWSQKIRSDSELQAFTEYLRHRVQQEINSSALMAKIFRTQIEAVIAGDQRLKFVHIRPILHALAQAGISNYSFETLNPALSQNSNHSHVRSPSHE